jgi:hypothetical protein
VPAKQDDTSAATTMVIQTQKDILIAFSLELFSRNPAGLHNISNQLKPLRMRRRMLLLALGSCKREGRL